jgi:hypothetical protein
LVGNALGYADPGGQVSLDADYDKDVARELLWRRKWVDVEDFLEGNGEELDKMPGIWGSEVGRGVNYDINIYIPVACNEALKVAGSVQSVLSKLMDIGEDDVSPGVLLMRQYVFGIFVRAR